MMPTWITFRYALISDLQIGADGTMYLPFAIYDFSRNFNPMVPFTHLEKAPSPHGPGRFTAGGVLRCLDGTQYTPDWDAISQGLGEWDGLFLNRAPVGDSNTLISLSWDFQEWRWKLAIYDDTLATKGSPTAPTADSNGVGSLIGNEVNVDLEWADLDATVYEWQVDDDSGFVAPVIASDTTSDPLATVTGLEPGVKYWWRVRALEPALSRWSDAQSFTTTSVAEIVAPTLIAPEAGEYILDTTPMFQWSAVGWADRYQIQVATDSGFGLSAMVIDEELGNVQALKSPLELPYETYYWHVKAMSDTSETEWSATGVFTIVKEMPGGGTAYWVWICVALAVVMLILITVLIVKHRLAV
jgi:hypothetical protein